MATDDPVELSFDDLVNPYFDDASLSGSVAPHLLVLMGGTAAGKRTLPAQPQARGHVRVDALELFQRMSQGQAGDFPGPFEELLGIVGGYIAARAVRERRHIVTELTGIDVDATKAMLDSMLEAGYRVEISQGESDMALSLQPGPCSAADAVLASYAEPCQREWLQRAAQAWLHGRHS